MQPIARAGALPRARRVVSAALRHRAQTRTCSPFCQNGNLSAIRPSLQLAVVAASPAIPSTHGNLAVISSGFAFLLVTPLSKSQKFHASFRLYRKLTNWLFTLDLRSCAFHVLRQHGAAFAFHASKCKRGLGEIEAKRLPTNFVSGHRSQSAS